jgi:hypothetical protein
MSDILYGYSAQYSDTETPPKSTQVSQGGLTLSAASLAAGDLLSQHDAGTIKLRNVNIFPMATVAGINKSSQQK